MTCNIQVAENEYVIFWYLSDVHQFCHISLSIIISQNENTQSQGNITNKTLTTILPYAEVF